MGGPARVPDAGGRFLDERRDVAVVGTVTAVSVSVSVAVGVARRPQSPQVANRAHRLDLAVEDQRQAGRVVAAILEALQTIQQELAARPLTCVADYSTHRTGWFSVVVPISPSNPSNRKEP